jgi:addiction module HigA family antidote
MLPKRRKPTHPGAILQEEFLKPLGWTPREFADKLGTPWSEMKVEAILNGRENLSDKAIQQFASALGTPASLWHHLQALYTQWESTHHHQEKGSLKPWKKAQ